MDCEKSFFFLGGWVGVTGEEMGDKEDELALMLLKWPLES